MKQVYIKTRAEWRNWLTQNHDKNSGIWLVFYKKHSNNLSLEYEAAVEEALCFGWIDSIIKNVDTLSSAYDLYVIRYKIWHEIKISSIKGRLNHEKQKESIKDQHMAFMRLYIIILIHICKCCRRKEQLRSF